MPTGGVKANPAIRKPGPITEAEKDAMRDLFAQGLGVADTARKLGLSAGQVSHWKNKLGLTAESKATSGQALATEAFAQKARRERHARRDRWQKIWELAADELEHDLAAGNQATTILKGMGGIETEVLVDKVPARDLRERFAALNLAEVALQKIDALEDDQGLARGLSMLEKFAQAATDLAAGTLGKPREGLIQE